MEETDREQRNRRFVRFWFIEQRVTTAFAVGAISGIFVYKLSGWPVVSFVIGFSLGIGALALMATHPPPQ